MPSEIEWQKLLSHPDVSEGLSPYLSLALVRSPSDSFGRKFAGWIPTMVRLVELDVDDLVMGDNLVPCENKSSYRDWLGGDRELWRNSVRVSDLYQGRKWTAGHPLIVTVLAKADFFWLRTKYPTIKDKIVRMSHSRGRYRGYEI